MRIGVICKERVQFDRFLSYVSHEDRKHFVPIMRPKDTLGASFHFVFRVGEAPYDEHRIIEALEFKGSWTPGRA